MTAQGIISVFCTKCGTNLRHSGHSWCKPCVAEAGRTNYKKKDQQAHRDRVRGLDAKKRSLKAGIVDALIETVDTAAIYKRDGGLCQLCGLPVQRGSFEQVLDHRIPVSIGGGHTADNLQLAHRQCNGWKGNDVQACYLPLCRATTLEAHRKAAGLTQRQVADLMGVTTKAVEAWESYKSPRMPRPNKRPHLCQVFGITRLDLEMALSPYVLAAMPLDE